MTNRATSKIVDFACVSACDCSNYWKDSRV